MWKLLNGAPLPNWVKLLALGASVGILVGANQVMLTGLVESQNKTTAAVEELRKELREKTATKTELLLIGQQIEIMSDRINVVELKSK